MKEYTPIPVNIYEQELFGNIHWRVMRQDGQPLMERIYTDYGDLNEAIAAVRADARRNHWNVKITVHAMQGAK